MGRLAPVSTAVSKQTAPVSRPLPEWVQCIQTHYEQSKRQYQQIAPEEDTEMIHSVQARVAHLDQEVENLIDCCNNEKEVIEVEFDDVRRDCEIFAQQVETNGIIGTHVLEEHDQQIRILDFMLKEARTGIDAIQDQSQQIIAGATEEFGKIKNRIEGYEKEQTQLKIKQAALSMSYNMLQKRVTDLENLTKKSLPNFEDLRVITDRVNEISNQTTGLTEAVERAKLSITIPERQGRIQRVQQWQPEPKEEIEVFHQ